MAKIPVIFVKPKEGEDTGSGIPVYPFTDITRYLTGNFEVNTYGGFLKLIVSVRDKENERGSQNTFIQNNFNNDYTEYDGTLGIRTVRKLIADREGIKTHQVRDYGEYKNVYEQNGARLVNSDKSNGERYDDAYGGDGIDWVFGNHNKNILHGGKGNDRVDGGDGNDVVKGNKGKDVLIGGGHDDTIKGGYGSDIMWGDGQGDAVGNDKFFFSRGKDIVKDYVYDEEEQDEIKIKGEYDISRNDDGDIVISKGKHTMTLENTDSIDEIFINDAVVTVDIL